jgi:rsbT co-antagonist protein RsbR
MGHGSSKTPSEDALAKTMTSKDVSTLAELLRSNGHAILPEWIDLQKKAGNLQTGRITENELVSQSRDFLHLLRNGLADGGNDVTNSAYGPAKQMLADISRASGLLAERNGYTFIFSLKQPLFNGLNRATTLSPVRTAELAWSLTLLLDELGVYTLEVFAQSREEVIMLQQREIAELSTPVVKLWDGILALPLIGTLDSQRTQVVMENLLQTIVDTEAQVAIIDYNCRAHRRHAQCTTSVEDCRRRQADGCQMSYQRYSSSNSPDHGASRYRVERHFQGDSGRRLCRCLD